MNISTSFHIRKLIADIKGGFTQKKLQFIEPIYDHEMLSSYLTEPSVRFHEKWISMLNYKHWQTIKAFNRRMCWEWDEFRDMKQVSDFHTEITRELENFLSQPKSWVGPATLSLKKRSIEHIKQEFSKRLLSFARSVILKKYSHEWESAMFLGRAGSTFTRKNEINYIIGEVLPDHRRLEAVEMKDEIKSCLVAAIDVSF